MKVLLANCAGPQDKYDCEAILQVDKLFGDHFGFCTAWSLFYMYMRGRRETLKYNDEELAKLLVAKKNDRAVCEHLADFVELVVTAFQNRKNVKTVKSK
jgi:hypothetical protein